MKKGDVTIGFGIMGGFNQAQAHAQFVANVVDFGLNIQAALDAPRFTKLTFEGCDVEIESGVRSSVLEELRAKGHELKVHQGVSMTMGRGNAVMRDGQEHQLRRLRSAGRRRSDPPVAAMAIAQVKRPAWHSPTLRNSVIEFRQKTSGEG